MRCQKCGKQLDSRARFCTSCDYDNYPEMNRVKTKSNVVKTQNTTVSTSNNVNTASSSTKNQPQKKPKVGFIIFIIVLIYILMNILGLGD